MLQTKMCNVETYATYGNMMSCVRTYVTYENVMSENTLNKNTSFPRDDLYKLKASYQILYHITLPAMYVNMLNKYCLNYCKLCSVRTNVTYENV